MIKFKNILNLFTRLFNRSNLTKILIIFIIGFIFRILINYIYGVNIYLDLLSPALILYYICISPFLLLVHELIIYIDFKIFSNIKLEEFKISSIKRLLKGFNFEYFNNNKMYIDSSVNEIKPYREIQSNVNKMNAQEEIKSNDNSTEILPSEGEKPHTRG
jgi:hypothetical protein